MSSSALPHLSFGHLHCDFQESSCHPALLMSQHDPRLQSDKERLGEDTGNFYWLQQNIPLRK